MAVGSWRELLTDKFGPSCHSRPTPVIARRLTPEMSPRIWLDGRRTSNFSRTYACIEIAISISLLILIDALFR